MTELDLLIVEIIELYHARKIPMLAVFRNPNGTGHGDVRCRFTGSVTQLVDLVSSSVMLLTDQLSKEFNLPQQDALEIALASIRDQVLLAKTKQEIS